MYVTSVVLYCHITDVLFNVSVASMTGELLLESVWFIMWPLLAVFINAQPVEEKIHPRTPVSVYI